MSNTIDPQDKQASPEQSPAACRLDWSGLTRRRFLEVLGCGAAGVGLWPSILPAAQIMPASRPASSPSTSGLTGRYGFISNAVLGEQPESEIRGRIAVMAQTYGIREFQFYDWFADYSTPVAGDKWTDPYAHRKPISRRTIEICIDEVHRQAGRAWAYVQTIGAEEQDLEDPAQDIWKLCDSKGKWYWHPPQAKNPRFPTYFANAAWARHQVGRWAPAVKQLGFDGIHWDTLGRIAGDYAKEMAGMHAFLRTAHELLAGQGLRQTMNMVDLAWWDRRIVRTYLTFPYAETWSPEVANRYFAEMDHPDMAGLRGVFAMYPSVCVPKGWTETDVIRARYTEAAKHHLAYLIVGDGPRHMRNEYWPDTVPLSPDEDALLKINNKA